MAISHQLALLLIGIVTVALAIPAEDLVRDPDLAIATLVDDGTLDIDPEDTVDMDVGEDATESQGEDCLKIEPRKHDKVCRISSTCKKETVATFRCDNYLGRGEPYQMTYSISPGKMAFNVQCDDCLAADQLAAKKPHPITVHSDSVGHETAGQPHAHVISPPGGSCSSRRGKCMPTSGCAGGSWLAGKVCNSAECCSGNDVCCAPASCEVTQTDAERFLANAAYRISTSSTGRCSDRYKNTCTSLDCARSNTIRGVVALAQYCRTAITITGGTETGHSGGSQSHFEGYKLNLRLETVLDSCIKQFKYMGKRPDGAALYQSTSGNLYAKSTHWDVTFTHGGV